ncbi:MAG: 16S rRNA (adenine(1518)-N(6)/adenine(1519)-N(6))-dimethyltransferase RsmA [Anaerofustis stercorihominis]|nr:16S rRNA (adenine(1518)-N(6)/adenine(1519)-N(6))-dimethyltransferase RsmA [Anaerofustis stercorihominis]
MASTLTNPAAIKEIMNKYNFYFKKDLGQNFLIDGNVADKIASAPDFTGEEIAIEVGPGIGALTELLADYAKKVIAVEIDPFALTMLRDLFELTENVEFVHSDILKVDLDELLGEYVNTPEKVSVVSNLPYYITSPVILKFLESGIKFKNITVMLQKEVAKRLAAKVGTKDYSSFTIAVHYYAEVEYLFDVSRNVFMPAPNVDSAVIQLTPRKTPVIDIKDEETFFKTVRAGFAMRRKTLLNCLSSGLSLSKDDVRIIMENAGIKENTRAESLSMEELGKLSDCVYDFLHK